mmetsp:Transcript_119343/g.337610  ORF Transcript_119343/g.337610 Transcript_119343/m.337610 type:complete len:201 (-) Transcript_119343:356-958(-)
MEVLSSLPVKLLLQCTRQSFVVLDLRIARGWGCRRSPRSTGRWSRRSWSAEKAAWVVRPRGRLWGATAEHVPAALERLEIAAKHTPGAASTALRRRSVAAAATTSNRGRHRLRQPRPALAQALARDSRGSADAIARDGRCTADAISNGRILAFIGTGIPALLRRSRSVLAITQTPAAPVPLCAGAPAALGLARLANLVRG